MVMKDVTPAKVDLDVLRQSIQLKYTDVALEPQKGFHFHTGRPLAAMLGYSREDVDWLPNSVVESFAGTGNPLSMGPLNPGETVVDLGCGAGFDTLLAARRVGPTGQVIGVDMTQAMIHKARTAAAEAGVSNIELRKGFAEQLPVENEGIDVVISNGVINLCPDKLIVMKEIFRVLRPGGRIQIGDIVVHKEVPQDAKDDIELWSG